MVDEEGEEELSINERWTYIKAVVKEVAEEEIGMPEHKSTS